MLPRRARSDHVGRCDDDHQDEVRSGCTGHTCMHSCITRSQAHPVFNDRHLQHDLEHAPPPRSSRIARAGARAAHAVRSVQLGPHSGGRPAHVVPAPRVSWRWLLTLPPTRCCATYRPRASARAPLLPSSAATRYPEYPFVELRCRTARSTHDGPEYLAHHQEHFVRSSSSCLACHCVGRPGMKERTCHTGRMSDARRLMVDSPRS